MDPTAGPLAALAHDLRRLRAAAGNPTYRALATRAGYSATTLSEAAGGSRLPTLEVLLAYVGACGGDPAAWRARWHAVAAAGSPPTPAAGGPAAAPPAAPPAGEPAAPAGAGPAGDPPADPAAAGAARPAGDPPAGPAAGGERGGRWIGRRARRRALFGVGGGLAAAVLAGGLLYEPDKPAADAAPLCPGAGTGAAFTGSTKRGGAHVRAGATRDATVLRTLPPECTVGFVGYCLGQKVRDLTGGYPDLRWFVLPGGGVVASAVVHGNPPAGAPPIACANARPHPRTLTLTATAGRDGRWTLRASGPDAELLGFAVSAPTAPYWRQAGWSDAGAAGAAATARTAATGQPATAVAAACYGGDGPSPVLTALALTTPRPRPTTLDPAAAAAAARAACRYPDNG
ncbi:helix-turn-helix domain-containing protein [Pilimelia anulata]|uniref:helix-turn-helix domain-containing protein n=1 Tax=Pilimelia anulata TaxID=53371 RepID=UPI001E2EF5BD|nr:helix-turn-helix transcriptional regulator [Pilimelia anulata]